MISLSRSSRLSPSGFHNLYSETTLALFSFFPSSSLAHPRSSTPTPKNTVVFNYLIDSFGFSKLPALSVTNQVSHTKKTLDTPQSVVQFLKSIGFSDAQIRSSTRCTPQILCTSIHKNLEPKIKFFQELGLNGSDLGKFISKNATLLTRSLDKRLKPCIEILKKFITTNDVNKDVIRVLSRCNWVVGGHTESRLLSNISYLKSCGIVGPQLSMLLVRQPRLFMMLESKLRDLVSHVLDMGFSINSRMLVHAIYTISCLSGETFNRKFVLFNGFGFSEVEFMSCFKKSPGLLRVSEEKLKLGLEFYMNTVKLKKTVLLSRPCILMYNIEDRVIPRYRVMRTLKSKKLLKKEPSFPNVLSLSEAEFLDKFISRFVDDAEELLVAYKGHVLDSLMV